MPDPPHTRTHARTHAHTHARPPPPQEMGAELMYGMVKQIMEEVGQDKEKLPSLDMLASHLEGQMMRMNMGGGSCGDPSCTHDHSHDHKH